jgi:hypothetical protein
MFLDRLPFVPVVFLEDDDDDNNELFLLEHFEEWVAVQQWFSSLCVILGLSVVITAVSLMSFSVLSSVVLAAGKTVMAYLLSRQDVPASRGLAALDTRQDGTGSTPVAPSPAERGLVMPG